MAFDVLMCAVMPKILHIVLVVTALSLAEEAAKKGDPQAHTLIGRLYSEGLGVPQDEATAVRWYARGAELGDVQAVFAMGVMLAEGRGVPKDRIAAGEMFERAARTGHVLANYNLGLLFLTGDGKPENPYRAAQHIGYAASKGVAAAQYDLGTLYQQGVGVPNDALEASRWIGKARSDRLCPVMASLWPVLLPWRARVSVYSIPKSRDLNPARCVGCSASSFTRRSFSWRWRCGKEITRSAITVSDSPFPVHWLPPTIITARWWTAGCSPAAQGKRSLPVPSGSCSNSAM